MLSLPESALNPEPEEFNTILVPDDSTWTHGPPKNDGVQYQLLHYQLASGYD